MLPGTIFTIYPTREAAQAVLDGVLSSAAAVNDDWTYSLTTLNDGQRHVISVYDEDGEFVHNLI